MTSDAAPRPPSRSTEPPESLLIELGVPASVDYLHTIRSVVGRAGHLLGFSFDGIEDLALAVDEAAVLLLELAPARLLLKLEGTLAGALDIRLITADPTRDWPPADLHSDARWHIVAALIDRSIALSGSETGIHMTQAPV